MSESKKPINLGDEVDKIYKDKNRNLSMEKLMLQKKHESEMAYQDGKTEGYYNAIRDIEDMLTRLKLR